MNPIDFKDLLNPDNSEIIKSFDEIIKAYKDMADIIKKSTEEIVNSIDKVNVTQKNGQDTVTNMSDEIKQLQEQYKLYTKRISELEKQNKKLIEQNEKIKEQKKQENDLNKAAEQLAKQRSRETLKLANAREKERQAAEKQAQQEKENAELLAREARTIAELQKQTSLLAKERRNLDKALNPKRFKELSEQIEANNQKLKSFDAEVGNYQRNVGDYLSVWQGMPSSLGAVGESVGGLGDAFKALLANPIIAVFSALVAVIGVLTRAFFKSEKGAKLMRKAQAFLSAGMEILIKLSEKAVDAVVAVFEDPISSLKAFGEALLNNVVNRVKGLINGFMTLGSTISALVKGDMKALKKASKEAGQALAQVATGQTPEDFEKVTKAMREQAAAAEKLAKEYEVLYEAQLQNEKLNQRLGLEIEKLTGQEQLLIDTADNSRLSFAERQKAAQEYLKVSVENAETQRKLAAANVAIIQKELAVVQNDFQKRREVIQRLNEARREEIRVNFELLQTRRDSLEKLSALESDNFEQRLDFAESFVDTVIEQNKTLIQAEETTNAERIRLQEDTVKKSNESWEKQKALIQAQAKGLIDFTALIKKDSAEQARARLEAAGLDEIAQTRVLSSIERRKKAQLEFIQLEKDVIKLNKDAIKKRSDAELKAFDQTQKLRKLQFEGQKRTTTESNAFVISQQIERYKKQLELAKKFPELIADTEVEIIKQQLKNAQSELANLGGAAKKTSLYKIIGINDAEKSNFQSTLSSALSGIKNFFSQRAQAAVDAAAKEVSAADEAIAKAEEAFSKQKELQEQGLANNAATAEKELEIARKQKQQALKDQEAAQKRQAAIETAQQASSLVTAVANIWKTSTGTGALGYILAGVATAALFASFAASKIQAKDATQNFSDGGFENIGGGTHASGNDTAFAIKKDGTLLKAERGESHAIFNGKATRYYGNDFLRTFVDNANSLSLDRAFAPPQSTYRASDYTSILKRQNKIASQSSEYLSRIAERESKSTYVDAKGQVIEEVRNGKGDVIKRTVRV